MELISLELLIRTYITLSKRPNELGWWGALCKVCNDHGRKGMRAGFKFSDDGSVSYNCFNCGHTASYHPNEREFSYDMNTVLDAFSIPVPERNKVLFQSLNKDDSHKTKRQQALNIQPVTIPLPPYFSPLDMNGDVVDQYACEYLKTRGIDWNDNTFYVGKQHTDPQSKKWFARLILPVFKDKNLIFYSGRDLTDTRSKKYLNPHYSRNNVLYGYDELFKPTTEPLYVVEGWFDAYHINGVAIFGNRMTTNQLIWLNKSRRPKVIIPDRFGDGHLLADQALSLGWSVSTPEIGDCKDVNDAIIRYGPVYTKMTIKKNTYSGFEGNLHIGMYCKGRNTK